MTPRYRAVARGVIAALAALGGIPADVAAADMPPASAQTPLRDPWVPPEARTPSTTAPTTGAALNAQVERKLKQAFDAADTGHTGALTREQAQAHGLRYISEHFDEIDRRNAGVVRFDDVKRFLRERGAKLD
jgi:hypothetical protein